MNRISEKTYRRVILGACAAVLFTAWGLGNHPLGLYSVPVTQAYGFSRSSFSVIFSVVNLFNAFGNFAFGPLHRRFGLKGIMGAGALLSAAAYGLFYLARSLPMFYLAAALFGTGLALITNSPVSVLLDNWFGEKKGVAVGLVFAASGIGGTVCDIAVGRMIDSLGFRVSLGVSGIVVTLVLGAAVALIRPHPVAAPAPAGTSALRDAPVSGLCLREALRTASFWLLVASELLWGLCIIPVVANMPAYLADRGFDSLFVSGAVMAVLYAVSACSKLTLGFVNDRLGPVTMITIMCAAGTAGTVLLAGVSGRAGALAAAVCMGIAFSCMTIPVPLLVGRIFGSRDYAAFVGFFTAALTLSGAAGTPLMNLLSDRVGSYLPCFAAQAVFFAVSALTAIAALRHSPRKGPEVPAAEAQAGRINQ